MSTKREGYSIFLNWDTYFGEFPIEVGSDKQL